MGECIKNLPSFLLFVFLSPFWGVHFITMKMERATMIVLSVPVSFTIQA
ncbi:hypothetical protein SBDP1_1030005 [Syntrophobacter sp. SbD1]|nr:hypothetical protein SBDP1_1030005 [Syntrophobacter sp. SbD1]